MPDGCQIFNVTGQGGGAIYIFEDGFVALAQGCTITETTARVWGGAIFASVGGRILVADCTITWSRTLQGDGGAIYADEGHVTLMRSTIAHASW